MLVQTCILRQDVVRRILRIPLLPKNTNTKPVTFQESIDHLHLLMGVAEQEFINLHKEFLRSHPEMRDEVRLFLESLGYLISGTLKFQRCTPRYHGANRQWVDVGSGLVTIDDTYTIVTPIVTLRPAANCHA